MADVEPGTVRIPSSTKTPSGEAGSGGTSSASGSRGADVKGKRPKLPSFWIPTLTPSAKPTEIKKPVSEQFCFLLYTNVTCCMQLATHCATCFFCSLHMHLYI